MNWKVPVDVEFTLPIRFQVLPLSVESSRLIDVACVDVVMGWPVTAFVSVPVMFVRGPFLETTAGSRLTVARVGVG